MTLVLTAGVSPSRVLREVITTSSSLHTHTTTKTGTINGALPLYTGHCPTPPPPPPLLTDGEPPYRWEQVSSHDLLVPCPHCTTCAEWKGMCYQTTLLGSHYSTTACMSCTGELGATLSKQNLPEMHFPLANTSKTHILPFHRTCTHHKHMTCTHCSNTPLN